MEKGHEKDIKDFLFLGSALLDITAYCNRDTLDKYGLKSDDCIQETDKHEALFQSLINDPNIQITAGGSSQNSARITKWVLEDRGRVYFAGCVGEDEYANKMLECLQSEGVEALYIPIPGESTGICACLLSSEGDRSMCTRLGAAQCFSEHHLHEKNIYEIVCRVKCVFIVGYFLSHSANVMLAVAEMCSDAQVFSMSLSAEYICRDYAETITRVLPHVDVLFSNEAEIKALAKSLHWNDVSVKDIAQMLARKDTPSKHKPRIVVVTRGPDPVLVAQGTDPPKYFPVPPGVKVVDGVGCGDAMAGGFLAVYVLTGDISLAAKTGITAAVQISQVHGCTLPRKKIFPTV